MFRNSILPRSSCSWWAKLRHERFGELGVRAERVHHGFLGIHPNTRLCGGNGIAVIGVGKEGGFGEELAPTSGAQNHQMAIDGAPDQAKPTAFDLVDGRSRVALPEE